VPWNERCPDEDLRLQFGTIGQFDGFDEDDKELARGVLEACTYQEAAEMPLCSLCLCVLCVRSNRRTARVDAMQAYSRGLLEHRAHRGTENTENTIE